MISPCDYLIVRLKGAFGDEITTKSGIKFFKAAHLDPEWSVTVSGEVVTTPNRLTRHTLSTRPDLIGMDKMEGRQGDEVIFSYKAIFHSMELKEHDTPSHDNLYYLNGELVWRIPYEHALAFVRDGELHPTQGYAFLQEAPETVEGIDLRDLISGSDINISKYMETIVAEEGKLVTAQIGHTVKKEDEGIVVAVGSPRTGETVLGINKGDRVRFRKGFAERYEYGGQKYLIIQQHYIKETL